MSGPEIKVAKVSDHLHATQHLAQSLQGYFPACTIDRDSRSIAILGVILVLLLREQITTFWRVYHLCTYKRCRKMQEKI